MAYAYTLKGLIFLFNKDAEKKYFIENKKDRTQKKNGNIQFIYFQKRTFFKNEGKEFSMIILDLHFLNPNSFKLFLRKYLTL